MKNEATVREELKVALTKIKRLLNKAEHHLEGGAALHLIQKHLKVVESEANQSSEAVLRYYKTKETTNE